MIADELIHGSLGSRRTRGIRQDAPIVPRAVAEAVCEEASTWLVQPLPRRWVRELVAHANTVYACNARFRRKVSRRNDPGRDWFWMFRRHWLAASFAVGADLPSRPFASIK